MTKAGTMFGGVWLEQGLEGPMSSNASAEMRSSCVGCLGRGRESRYLLHMLR